MGPELPSPAQPFSLATGIRISRRRLLNPRSLIPTPDVLVLNFEHVPPLTLRHPSCSPCQSSECRQALLQLWTSVSSVLRDEVGPFPQARPGPHWFPT